MEKRYLSSSREKSPDSSSLLFPSFTMRLRVLSRCCPVLLAIGISMILSPSLFAQTNSCATAVPIAVNSGCVNVAYSIPSGYVNSGGSACTGVVRDGWYIFNTSDLTNRITVTVTTNRDVGFVVYSGTCGSLTQVACRDNGGSGTTETLAFGVSPNTTHYLRIYRYNSGSNDMTGNVCIASGVEERYSSCATTFSSGTYGNNLDNKYRYCPTSGGNCIQAAFSSFNMENGYDYMHIYDGPSVASPLIGSYTGGTSPGTINTSGGNTSGCLTLRVTSDGSSSGSGWDVSLSCIGCSALPVELLDFNGTAEPSFNLISWITASESNNREFVVEKSDDGLSWQEIARQDGAGNSNSLKHYRFEDHEPFVLTYYRLTQIDYDGTSEQFNPIVLSREAILADAGERFALFPNPAGGFLNIQLLGEETSLQQNRFFLIDAMGREVLSRQLIGSDKHLIDISSLTPGIYTACLQDAKRINYSKLVVK